MDNLDDFKQTLDDLEMGWTNQWAFIDQRDELLRQKKLALKNKTLLKKKVMM